VLIDMHAHIIPGEFPPVGERAAGEQWPRMKANSSGADARRLLPGGLGGTGLRWQEITWNNCFPWLGVPAPALAHTETQWQTTSTTS
jgi:hypothetical protein